MTLIDNRQETNALILKLQGEKYLLLPYLKHLEPVVRQIFDDFYRFLFALSVNDFSGDHNWHPDHPKLIYFDPFGLP